MSLVSCCCVLLNEFRSVELNKAFDPTNNGKVTCMIRKHGSTSYPTWNVPKSSNTPGNTFLVNLNERSRKGTKVKFKTLLSRVPLLSTNLATYRGNIKVDYTCQQEHKYTKLVMVVKELHNDTWLDWVPEISAWQHWRPSSDFVSVWPQRRVKETV